MKNDHYVVRRVLRGGSWVNYFNHYLCEAFRYGYRMSDGADVKSFRLVCFNEENKNEKE